MRCVAVDWSGRVHGARRHIWTGEVVDGELVRLECGLGREEVARDQLARAADGEPVVVGLDFAFSLPGWFMAEQRFGTVNDLWRAGSSHARWLADCPHPFWGHPGRRRPDLGARAHYRRTELEAEARFGTRPKSGFQIGGVGAVGTGSVRGFAVLDLLQREGFAIWPFDAPSARTVIELWPRLLTGPVVKSSRSARVAYLASMPIAVGRRHRARMEDSQDAFDAGISALGMWSHRAALTGLPAAGDDLRVRVEGGIWLP